MADDAASSNHTNEEQMKEDEADIFLGANPTTANSSVIEIGDDIADRIKASISKGLSEKEEKENLLNSIPRKEKLNLEAPVLNEKCPLICIPRLWQGMIILRTTRT